MFTPDRQITPDDPIITNEPITSCIACGCEIFENDVYHKDPAGVPICNDVVCIEWNREIDLKHCLERKEKWIKEYYDKLISHGRDRKIRRLG